MFDWIKENSTAFIVAVVLHVIFLGALFINWQMDKPDKVVMEQGDIIQVTSVDANAYDAEIKKIAQEKQAKKRLEKQRIEKRRKDLELKKKKKQAQARLKKEKQKKAEQLKRKKVAAAKKKKAEQEKKTKEAQRKKEEIKRKEEQKKAEQEKQRLKEQKKHQQAEQKRKAEEEAKHQAELKRQEERAKAERERRSKGIVKRHVAMIAQKIERNWRQPLDAPADLKCKIDIVLQYSGNVVSVKVVESSGNLAFDRSVETAVRKASPLPVPTDSVIFKQFEVMRLRFEPGR